MIVSYLTGQYGRPSDTFIRREVAALRELGLTVHTFSVRRPPAPAEVPAELAEARATTDYLLDRPGRVLAGAALAGATHPRRALGAATAAFRSAPPGTATAARQGVYLAEALALSRKLRAVGAQVIHNHIAEASSTVAMLAARIAGIPFTQTVHGPGIFYRPERWALGQKIEDSAFTACISHFCRSQCMVFTEPQHWPKLVVVRCGLDAAFLDASPRPAPNRPKLVCVGRLTPEKGCLILLEAVRRVADRGRPVEVELIGDGPQRGAIEAAIARLGLTGSVAVKGWLGSDAVAGAITSARALVLPSFAEGLPVVLMEALAMGRPVVTTRIAAVAELVEPGVSGWLVNAGDPASLAEAIGEVLDAAPPTLDRMGAAGRDRVRRQHDVLREAGLLADLFRRAVGGPAIA